MAIQKQLQVTVPVPTLPRLQETIADHIAEYRLRFPALDDLLTRLAGMGRTVLFGGFVRDCMHNLLHSDKVESRDIDIVVDGIIVLPEEDSQQNNFGGRRCTINAGLKADYWELRGTYAVRKGFFEPKLENLPHTTVYTPNACIFDLQSKELIENHAVEDIARRVVAFNCRSYLDLFPEYQAFRAIDLAVRLQYSLETEVEQFVRGLLNSIPWDSFVAAVQRHRPELTRGHLHELCREYR